MTALTPLECPLDCGRTRRPAELMCPTCWRKVSRDLQAEVYRTWRAYKAANVHHHRFPEISRAYKHARDEAIRSVR